MMAHPGMYLLSTLIYTNALLISSQDLRISEVLCRQKALNEMNMHEVEELLLQYASWSLSSGVFGNDINGAQVGTVTWNIKFFYSISLVQTEQ